MDTNDGIRQEEQQLNSNEIETEREIQKATHEIIDQIETNIEDQVIKEIHNKQHATSTVESLIQIEISANDTHNSSHLAGSSSNRPLNAVRYQDDKSTTTTREPSDLLNHEFINNLDSNLANHILTPTILEKETYVSQGVNTDQDKDNQLEQIAVETITDTNETKKQVKTYLDELKSEIKTLTQRCDQFNDVKQTIKSMNDLIREEIFLDFGSIITMMRCKLDELTNQIKEKLKDAYSVVRDRQEKITSRLDEIKRLSEQIETNKNEPDHDESTLNKLKQTREQIDSIYDELKQICDSAPNAVNPITVTATSVINSISNCSNNCSLFIDNNLYPQFNYFIDMSKLIADINSLTVQITSTPQQNNFNRMSLIPNENASVESNDLIYEYLFEQSYYCKVTSRLNNDGSFWVKILCAQADIGVDLDENNNLDDYDSTMSSKRRHIEKCFDKTNAFIEELSKYVRRKRIGDKTWLTYSESKRIPNSGEKCFCLEGKTRKWLRGTIESYDSVNNMTNIRFMDTGGHIEVFTSLDNILIWHDEFELAHTAPRSLKCYLDLGKNNTYFGANNEHICLETKFHFKDTVVVVEHLKCTLIKRKLNDEWTVNLFDGHKLINELIVDFNSKELMGDKSTFRSTDIRLDSGQITEISNHTVKSAKTEENNNNAINIQQTSEFVEEQEIPTTTTTTQKDISQTTANQPSQHQENQDGINTSFTLQQQQLQQPQPVLSDYSEIEDQNEERRGFKSSYGKCLVHRPITEDGIFWIKPTLEHDSDLNAEYQHMSKNLGEYIVKTQWKPYGLLNISPILGRKCFVRVVNSVTNDTDWYRGLVERYVPHSNPRKYLVRSLDNGHLIDCYISDIYPHRRFSSDSTNYPNRKTKSFDTKLEYLAIRCSLTPSGYPIKLNQNLIRLFYRNVCDHTSNGNLVFNLIEQVRLNPNTNRKCWHTELKVSAESTEILNYKIIQAALNDPTTLIPDKFKYVQLIKSKILVDFSIVRPSRSIELSNRSSEPNSSFNMSWPSNSEDQKRQSKSRKKRNTKDNKTNNQQQQQRPLRRKSKSFDHIPIINDTANDTSNSNEKVLNQNEEYHTIASGTGVAAAAVALQQSADLSTKYQHYKEKEKLPSNSSSNSTYSSMPYSSPLLNASLKPDQTQQHQEPIINSTTITIDADHNKRDDVSNKSKFKHRHHKSTNDACKTDAKYHKSFNKRDDDDDDDDLDRNNFRRRAHTTGDSHAAYHRSFGERHSHNTANNDNRNKNTWGRKYNDDDDDDYNQDYDDREKFCDFCCDYNNQPEHTITVDHSYLAELNSNFASSAFNDVFIPVTEQDQKENKNKLIEETSLTRFKTEMQIPQRPSSFHQIYTNNELDESEIEALRSNAFNQQNNENDLNINNDDHHNINNLVNEEEESLRNLKNSIDNPERINGCIKIMDQSDEGNKSNSDKENIGNNTTLLHDATQAIAFRHIYVSPLMSTDSSQKYIQDQQQLMQSSVLTAFTGKQRSYSDDLINTKYTWQQRQPQQQQQVSTMVNTPINSKKLISSSSSSSASSAASSFNKTPQNGTRIKKNTSSSVLLNKEDEENDDLYASCAEDPENNNVNFNLINDNINNQINDEDFCYIRNSSPTTLIAPLIQDDNHTLITRNTNKEAQTDDLSILMNNKKDKLKKFTVAIFIDSFDDYSLNKSISSSSSENETSPNRLAEKVIVNSSELIQDDNILSSSLKEFELNEANLLSVNQQQCTPTTQQQSKTLTPQLTDEVFMFTSNPNNYDNLLHFKNNVILASKPPLIPNTNLLTNNQHQHSHQQAIPFFNISSSNQCLSTITECSNETFETCSNQSPSNNTNNNNTPLKDRVSDEFEDTIINEKNITFRKSLNKKSSVKIDDLFAKFCLDANDDIMLCSENNSINSVTSNSSSPQITVQNQEKISSKLLEEVINQQVDTPTFSSSSSSSSLNDKKHENENENFNVNKRSSAGGLDTNNFENLDEVEDEVFLKSNPNQIVKSCSLSSASSNNNQVKTASTSSSTVSSPLPIEKLTKPVTVASPNITNTGFKMFKTNLKSAPNMNVSSTTTLEISSFDSIFNSNLVITPFGSEAVSPFTGLQLLNNTTQSLSLFNNNNISNTQQQQQQQSPLTLSNKQYDFVDSKSVKQIRAQLQQQQQQLTPPPPLPPLPINQINSAIISPTFPSPPKLATLQSPFSDTSTSPFPPPPPPLEFFPKEPTIEQSATTSTLNKQKELLKKLVTSQQLNSKKNFKSNQPQSLIETITARLNLISNKNNNNNNNTLKKPNKIETKTELSPNKAAIQKAKILSPPKINNSSVNSNLANIITTNNNINKAGYASLGSLFKTNLQKSPITLTSNNAPTRKEIEQNLDQNEDDDGQSSLQWKASNLYGLDTEEYDDQHSIKDHEELEQEFEKSFPPPPAQFDDNRDVSFKTPLTSKLNLPLPTLPSFKQLKTPPLPPQSQPVVAQQQNQNISLNTTNDTIRRFWNNLTSNSITPEPPVATTSLKPINKNKKEVDLNNNLKMIKEQDLRVINQSCPNIVCNGTSTNKSVEPYSETSHISSTDSYLNDISEPTEYEQFKLDHLSNINPKKLYKNCKFKGKIHDIIDESGQFWLEVIYPRNDEIKFNQMFRLFRLVSRISQAPKTLYVQKFVSALYKDNWYRGVVLELHADNKALIRYLDLGVAKLVDRYIELREIDEKYFNFPLKALHCTICLDSMKGMKLSKDSRKFFTRLIYKRCLFVKLVDFIEVNNLKTNHLVLHQNRFEVSNQLCQVILGCQTQRGIIDVCMYLLSKYDRKRYESIKHHKEEDTLEPVSVISAAGDGGVNAGDDDDGDGDGECEGSEYLSSSMTNLRNVICDQNMTKSTSTSYLNLPSNPTSRVQQLSQQQQQHQQQQYQQYYDEIDTRKRIQSYEEEDHHDDEDLEDYVEEKVNESVNLNDTELLDNIYEPEQTDSESNQYENEIVITNDDDNTEENAMFTDILNSCCIDSNNIIFNIDNTILYRESEGENDDNNGDEDDYGLDYLPVKDDNNVSKNSSHKGRSFNYSEMLRFDSIHLPGPPTPSSQIPSASDFRTPVQYANLKNGKYTGSTVVASRTKYIRHMNHYNMPFPPSNPLKSGQMNTLNYSSDTDSSMLHGTACCSGPIKLKWNASNLQKLKQKLNKPKETPEVSSIVYNNVNELDDGMVRMKANTSTLSSKKVKFQIK